MIINRVLLLSFAGGSTHPFRVSMPSRCSWSVAWMDRFWPACPRPARELSEVSAEIR